MTLRVDFSRWGSSRSARTIVKGLKGFLLGGIHNTKNTCANISFFWSVFSIQHSRSIAGPCIRFFFCCVNTKSIYQPKTSASNSFLNVEIHPMEPTFAVPSFHGSWRLLITPNLLETSRWLEQIKHLTESPGRSESFNTCIYGKPTPCFFQKNTPI